MPWRDTQISRLRRLFLEGFTALDVAEPLVSFDAETDAPHVQPFLTAGTTWSKAAVATTCVHSRPMTTWSRTRPA